MATRPVYLPTPSGEALVRGVDVEFQWHPGLSLSQKQRSIESLHVSAQRLGLGTPLEISTKSPQAVGRALSAFSLQFPMDGGRRTSVESAFQAGKVFAHGGPFLDLLERSAREAKTDQRLKLSGPLVAFQLGSRRWSLQPETAFYDWLYCCALVRQPDLAASVVRHPAFTDIEFNPAKSLNCQAKSAALFVALSRRGQLQEALHNADGFISIAFPDDSSTGRLF